MSYEPQVAATVIGVAGFQLIQVWNAHAPTLEECRRAHPDDVGMHQRLMDADYLVGGLTVILGTSFALLSKDMTALLVMTAIYGSISLWYHQVLKAESR